MLYILLYILILIPTYIFVYIHNKKLKIEKQLEDIVSNILTIYKDRN